MSKLHDVLFYSACVVGLIGVCMLCWLMVFGFSLEVAKWFQPLVLLLVGLVVMCNCTAE